MRERKGVDLGGWGRREDLGVIVGGEIITIVYCILKKTIFSLKREVKNFPIGLLAICISSFVNYLFISIY